MKVFMNKRYGGMILAAANSPEEAHKVFHSDKSYAWVWHEWNGEIFDDFYHQDGWEEIPLLHYAGVKPRIITKERNEQ